MALTHRTKPHALSPAHGPDGVGMLPELCCEGTLALPDALVAGVCDSRTLVVRNVNGAVSPLASYAPCQAHLRRPWTCPRQRCRDPPRRASSLSLGRHKSVEHHCSTLGCLLFSLRRYPALSLGVRAVRPGMWMGCGGAVATPVPPRVCRCHTRARHYSAGTPRAHAPLPIPILHQGAGEIGADRRGTHQLSVRPAERGCLSPPQSRATTRAVLARAYQLARHLSP
ncbi:hypothetical protein C8R47DRAFT_654953 [Mycena vitilis]|nr:hypothetical protein C8R47DRAFT_654953 [Mycena vitilis]